MTFLLANWKFVIIGILLAGNVLLWNLWRSEVEHFYIYEARIKAVGEEAERKAREVEVRHEVVLQGVKDEFNKQLPKVREDAVANFKRRYANGLSHNSGSSNLPQASVSPQGANGASQEPVDDSASVCPDEFIQDSAEDALKIQQWQKWTKENQLEVK